jgi:tRNA pseudouridine65 synthase
MPHHQPLTLLAQGDGWVVVAKPPRLVVHRGQGTRGEYAALQRLRDQLGAFVYPIHRLDRAASGCLLFATRQELAGPLHAAMHAPETRKTYLAFVRGWFKPEGPVLVDNPMKDDNGVLKEARSEVRCLGRGRDPRCSLLEVWPETGRYHQVRRHVRDLTHPIIGDSNHGDTRINRWWKVEHGVRRLGLHALALEMTFPDGQRRRIVCPLFKDQAKLFRRMPWWEDALEARPELGLAPLAMLDAPGEEEPDGP